MLAQCKHKQAFSFVHFYMITCSLKRSSEGCVWLGRWSLYANHWSDLDGSSEAIYHLQLFFFIFLPQGFLCHWIAGGVNEVFSEHNSCEMIYSRLNEPFVVISLSVRRTVAWVWLVCAWLAASGGVVDGQMLYSFGIKTDKSAAWCWCWMEESLSYHSELKIEADGMENTVSYHSCRLVPSPMRLFRNYEQPYSMEMAVFALEYAHWLERWMLGRPAASSKLYALLYRLQASPFRGFLPVSLYLML